MTKTYAVSYEGWLIIDADTEAEAQGLANKMLSDSGITNDGSSGQWELSDTVEEDYDD
jgi:hypothetical protein